jgi:hypothetical protein
MVDAPRDRIRALLLALLVALGMSLCGSFMAR